MDAERPGQVLTTNGGSGGIMLDTMVVRYHRADQYNIKSIPEHHKEREGENRRYGKMGRWRLQTLPLDSWLPPAPGRDHRFSEPELVGREQY